MLIGLPACLTGLLCVFHGYRRKYVADVDWPACLSDWLAVCFPGLQKEGCS